jgi:hypothetical protein
MTEHEILEAADVIIVNGLREELKNQGHHLTGALEESIKGEITAGSNQQVLTGFSLHYGGIINAGVSPARIPFSGRTGSGGTSKYIQGIIQYWMLRGLDEKEATRAAFATAYVHMHEGMSTAASSAFSSTGERQGFIDAVAEAINEELDETVLSGYDELIDEHFRETKSETI